MLTRGARHQVRLVQLAESEIREQGARGLELVDELVDPCREEQLTVVGLDTDLDGLDLLDGARVADQGEEGLPGLGEDALARRRPDPQTDVRGMVDELVSLLRGHGGTVPAATMLNRGRPWLRPPTP